MQQAPGSALSWRIALAAALLASLSAGCSVRWIAVNKIGDALAETGSNFASDDDPELVGDAIPFGLKTMEGLLESAPRHKGLLLAAASGFVQYAYGWVQMEGDMVEAKDLARATELRERARKLYLRARDYGLRGLEVDFPACARRSRATRRRRSRGRRRSTCPSSTGRRWAGPGRCRSRSTTPT